MTSRFDSGAPLIGMAAAMVLPAMSRAQGPADESSVEPGSFGELAAEIESMRVEDVAWRKIPWKTCLLEGLSVSRDQEKPLILWVFIDRPVDDKRC